MTKPLSAKLCRSVGEAAQLLKLLANPNRLSILCYLMQQEATVAAMEAELGIRQPTLSQQLSALRDAGLIKGRRAGKSVSYRAADRRAAAVVETLRGLYAGLDDVTGRQPKTARRATPAPGAAIDVMFD